MNLHEPIAVQIEQIMIAAPPGPQTPMLHGLIVGVRHLAGKMSDLPLVSLAPVRVHQRVDVYDQLLAQTACRLVGPGDQLIRHL